MELHRCVRYGHVDRPHGIFIGLSRCAGLCGCKAPAGALPLARIDWVMTVCARSDCVGRHFGTRRASHGTRLAHALSGPVLKRIFAIFLLLVGSAFAYGALRGSTASGTSVPPTVPDDPTARQAGACIVARCKPGVTSMWSMARCGRHEETWARIAAAVAGRYGGTAPAFPGVLGQVKSPISTACGRSLSNSAMKSSWLRRDWLPSGVGGRSQSSAHRGHRQIVR